MKTSKIQIKSLFGIKEISLNGDSVEISGPKGAGKTSVLDAIRYALTNRSERDCVVHAGEDQGEIIVETDTGLKIDRKVDAGDKAGSVKVWDNGMLQGRPAEFLSKIFVPLQLNPIEFTQMSRQEKNRVILSLIQFDWDLNWIRDQFGEIPQGVDYSKHILEVLNDIQSEKGVYFQTRQDLNRDIRNKRAFIEDIAKDIPAEYDAEKWANYPISEKYQELTKAQDRNSKIQRAKVFLDSKTAKLRGIEGDRDVAISAIDREISSERTRLTSDIERMEAEIRSAKEKMAGLEAKRDDKVKVIAAEYDAAKAKLDADMGTAEQYAGLETVDISGLQAEIDTADAMRKHLNEYARMIDMQTQVDGLQTEAEELTRKIELARELPSKILAEAEIPVKGLTVKDGVPLINGLPISNLSDGELLELCVDISVSNPGQLQIILIDGAERLDQKSREVLYQKCKDKGLQMIATRVADTDEMEVTVL